MNNKQKQIKNWINKNNGYLVIHLIKKEIKELSYKNLKYYINKNPNLIKVKRGLYREEEAWEDIFYEISVMNPNMIVSHESALYFHNLIEREPLFIDFSVYSGYHFKKENKMIKIKYIDKKNHNLGLIKKKTEWGNEIQIYNMERTMCDLVKNKENMDIEVFSKAWNLYMKTTEKNIPLLSEYAEKLNIQNKISNIMEVLIC